MAATLTRSAFEADVGDAQERRVIRLGDWTEEEIAALEASAMAPGHEALNAELDESGFGR